MKNVTSLKASKWAAALSSTFAAFLVGCGSAPAVAPAAAPPPSGTAGERTAPAFVHPGILVSRPMLELVRRKIAEGAEPWTSALRSTQQSELADLRYVPMPREVVECGSYSNPNHGCSDEQRDVMAAYTHALLWVYTGRRAHADKAIEIMNAWSALVREHTNRNAPLQSAWAAEVFPRAAEIIRYTGGGWAEPDVTRFSRMLREVYLPQVIGGSASNGNWEASMIEAALNVAVFTDDRPTFDHALAMWRARTPAYIYLAKDGATPVPPPRSKQPLTELWYGQTTLWDGLAQETCRDMHHVQYGLSALLNTAETAYLQGVDLYGEQAERLKAGLEFHARYLNGAPVPSTLCGGALSKNAPNPTWELAVNHFVTRRGESLPESQRLVLAIRPTATDHHTGWETLTHAGVGDPR
jgi:hypothetical protein